MKSLKHPGNTEGRPVDRVLAKNTETRRRDIIYPNYLRIDYVLMDDMKTIARTCCM